MIKSLGKSGILHFVLLTFFIFLSTISLKAQSKKEQIENLNRRYDSLLTLIIDESILSEKLAKDYENDILNLTAELKKLELDLNSVNAKIKKLKTSNNSLALMRDSLQSTIEQTVTIGTQVWKIKNLNVDRFRNGDLIPEAKTLEDWELAYRDGKPAWCYYNNDPANGERYGRLYNWYAVNDPRGLAPIGYHIPTDAEWTVLVDYLGGTFEAGEKMKSKNGWLNGGNGTNSSGFTGLPGGFRVIGHYDHNTFDLWNDEKSKGYWWSSTGWYRWLYYGKSIDSYDGDGRMVGRESAGTDGYFGFSVRLLKDSFNNFDSEIRVVKEIPTDFSETVTIGKQIWKTKNLNVDKFRNGDPIPHVKNDEEWIRAGWSGKPAWRYYDDDPTNGLTYGKLYNWYAVNDPRRICPEGYRVPSENDWQVLIDYLGGEEVAGEKMKSTSGWDEFRNMNEENKKNGNGTNESGFSALPAGSLAHNSQIESFKSLGSLGGWWSSFSSGTRTAASLSLDHFRNSAYSSSIPTYGGLSIRCFSD